MSAPVRLSELVATMALVSDLGIGRPMDRAMRQTLIAMRLAEAAQLDREARADAYYTSLLSWVGCAADTRDFHELFGDEITMYADAHAQDLSGMSMAAFTMRHLGGGESRLRRIGMMGAFLATAGRSVQQAMQQHCEAASEFALRLDLGHEVSRSLLQAFERWDGRGVPGKAGADELGLAIRIVHLADNVEALYASGGVQGAREVARERRGTQFDPKLVDCFLEHCDDILAGLGEVQAWDEVIRLDPRLNAPLADDELDHALESFADFADLKSPSRLGHSRGVAALAAGAARQLGLGSADQTLVRRAALVHDIGMIGVPSGVWEERRPWSLAQRERAQTHPYLTERMLARVPALAAVARCAALHHERLDGTGYPHGLTRDAIPMPARILAAADVYQALGQDRPHRAAMPPDQANLALRDEARAGRLDGDAVAAVLVAAGQRTGRKPLLPSGLTAREVEVLLHLARGLSNPEIASALSLSRKTVSTHLEHIYTKLAVTTRTQAALYAMREGLAPENA
jgi:HD-GYP domain-containing protein (c-di-GMP phosphodiesterase class II)